MGCEKGAERRVPGTLLTTTRHADLQPLVANGVRVFHALRQIRAELRKALTDQHASLFAEPIVDPVSGDVQWYAPVTGETLRLVDLPPALRREVEHRLADLVVAISEYSEELQLSANETVRHLGRILFLALEIPSEAQIFVVADQPVLVAWGHVPRGPAAPHRLLLFLAGRVMAERSRPASSPVDSLSAGQIRNLELNNELGESLSKLIRPDTSKPKEEGMGLPIRRLDAIEFGVSHPTKVALAVPFLIDAWVFGPKDREQAVARAREEAVGLIGFRSGGSAEISRGSNISVRLDIPSWHVEPSRQTLVWAGHPAKVSFSVTPIADIPSGKAIGRISFLLSNLRIGQLRFELPLRADAASPRALTFVSPVRNAFASYASRDRARVFARVQGMEKVGVNVFVDVRNLTSNVSYPEHLLQQIENSDVLYLFWSRHAKASPWVEREWRHGLQHGGTAFIDPVPLANPRKVRPPAELAGEKHFDHWTLAYSEYEKSLSLLHRLRLWLAGE
jgi:TIR domain